MNSTTPIAILNASHPHILSYTIRPAKSRIKGLSESRQNATHRKKSDILLTGVLMTTVNEWLACATTDNIRRS
jgi:hypothetical protein